MAEEQDTDFSHGAYGLNLTDADDRLDGETAFAVARRFVDALERIELSQLVERKAALQK